MTILDSSALIPLARTGNLNLLNQLEQLKTTPEIRKEVLEQGKGKKGTSELKKLFEKVEVKETNSKKAEEIVKLEGITKADASLTLLAEKEEEVLLSNDKALIQIARMKNIECYWLTTLILISVKKGILSKDEAKEILYNLVQEGMNLKNNVYTKIMREIDKM